MDCDAMWESGAALAYRPAEYRIKWAALPWEIGEAYRLRRAVFCVEQGVFVGDDLDEADERAQLLVAVSGCAGLPDQVVGTVRIHETAPGIWLGSRLAVHAAFRTHGRIGTTLIGLAVSSAHALGCREFHAHVQVQNVPLFERLHWRSLGEEMLHGRLHHRMLADLAHYPPCATPYAGFVMPAGGAR
ncbi:GNAT family N-acetyltransferase [Burkholderia sp. Ap-962]|uniref:MSMEG_0567/Sll0786 family nitrogen starvation N-acetyltransferase n=1 Tax=Burkholderia sp. Ap-962 TaxID=2608333 RepID=UPI001422CE34|nr:MSMEG_0567/Sll0786 family nitrogen starvation N-acetyltransferase [Burkholderia sp. Ap-962]NIF73725.1 GNAT family N-acetyltransferase [Burkholderia sp. Ap-962]